MSRTDAMRWRDWPLDRARFCPSCGTEFLPDVQRQELCRTCAQREADAERAPVTAAEGERTQREHRERMALASSDAPRYGTPSRSRSRPGPGDRQDRDLTSNPRSITPHDPAYDPDRVDGIVVVREITALSALSVTEWRDFATVRELSGMKSRSLGAALRRLQRSGRAQRKGHGEGELWRRMQGKPDRCSACGRPFDQPQAP